MIFAAPPVERDLLRLRDEFTSLPGLTLTSPQTARLLGVREGRALRLLDDLEQAGFLSHSRNGVYFRPRFH